jgi:hypothetical protein
MSDSREILVGVIFMTSVVMVLAAFGMVIGSRDKSGPATGEGEMAETTTDYDAIVERIVWDRAPVRISLATPAPPTAAPAAPPTPPTPPA